MVPDKPHDYEVVLDDHRLKQEKKCKIIDCQINKEKAQLNYRYEKVNPAKQLRDSPVMKRDLSILMMNMEKVKTFKNLAFIP